jgi:hypothetical protein
MRHLIAIFILAGLGAAEAEARDGFEKVRCDRDIAKALVGQRGANEPVAATEARHKDLGLRDLGGDEIDDRSASVSWLICGREFMVLEDVRTSTIRDAIEIPPHSKMNPKFFAACTRAGKPAPDFIVAILRDEAGKDELPAQAARSVDVKALRFVRIATDGLLCPRSGIVESAD